MSIDIAAIIIIAHRLEQSFQSTLKLLQLKIKATTATHCFLSSREGTMLSSTPRLKCSSCYGNIVLALS